MLRLQVAARSARGTATTLGARHCSCSQLCVPPRRVAVSIDARMLWHCWAAFCCQLYHLKMRFPGRVTGSCALHGVYRVLSAGTMLGHCGCGSDTCGDRVLSVTPGGARLWGAGRPRRMGGDVADPGDGGSAG